MTLIKGARPNIVIVIKDKISVINLISKQSFTRSSVKILAEFYIQDKIIENTKIIRRHTNILTITISSIIKVPINSNYITEFIANYTSNNKDKFDLIIYFLLPA